MTPQGIVLIDVLAVGLLILLIDLVRTKRLYPGYAVIWISAIAGMMVLISVPLFLEALPGLVGAVYPASALSLLVFIFIFLVLVFMSVKFSTITNRQIQIIQLLAIRALEDEERKASDAEADDH